MTDIPDSHKLQEKAIEIAVTAHAGRQDRYGEPYVLHVIRVGMAGRTWQERVAGFLHDVVEDCEDWTLERLRASGFPAEIVTAVDHLTRREGEDYEAFITRSCSHPLARKVKRNDLTDNLNMTRVKGKLDESDRERLNRYLKAVQTVDSTF